MKIQLRRNADHYKPHAHYDFGIAGWNAAEMRRKVAAHGLQITPSSRGDDESFKFNDPDGFVVQVNGPEYTGHVGS